ncbi:MAG: tRNA (adenosine(37)-N6)-threonylcarbamoyltransferase complex dimerization subunit type 1 TsaB [Patescibacteria group bacterium]
MILFTDTTSDQTIIALFCKKDFVKIDEIKFESKGMQSELLIFSIDKLLKKHAISKQDIEIIMAVPGPGSYTGLRIGLATLNSMAFALNIPIVGVESPGGKKEIISAFSQIKGSIFDCPVLPKYKYPPKITQSTRT